MVFLCSSNLSNFLNNLSILSLGIPLPVSSIDIINLVLLSLLIQLTLNSTNPSSVYFAALVSKLVIISLTFELSPYKIAGKSLLKLVFNSIGLSPILGTINFFILFNISGL